MKRKIQETIQQNRVKEDDEDDDEQQEHVEDENNNNNSSSGTETSSRSRKEGKSKGDKYEIIISRRDYEKMLSDAKVDKKEEHIKHIENEHFRYIETEVRKVEDDDSLELQSRINRVYFQIGNQTKTRCERKSKSYITWNANCKDCKCSYKFLLDKVPKETEKYIKFRVTRSNPHTHDPNKRKQLRGERRLELVKDVVLYYGGSARTYCLKQKEKGLEPPSEKVIRKAISEEKKRHSLLTSESETINNNKPPSNIQSPITLKSVSIINIQEQQQQQHMHHVLMNDDVNDGDELKPNVTICSNSNGSQSSTNKNYTNLHLVTLNDDINAFLD